MNESLRVNEQNFEIFAAKHYDNIFYDTVEFQIDLKRFAYLKRLFNHYKKSGELKDRLILNHLVIIYNLWSNVATDILFVKLRGYESILKSFLVYMERMPQVIYGIGLEQRNIISADIETDDIIISTLRNNEKLSLSIDDA